MTNKLITPEVIFKEALSRLDGKTYFGRFRDTVATVPGEEGWPGYRWMTEEEIKARDEANIQREVRNKALVDQAFAKLSQEEIEALEWYYSSEFY